MSSPEVLLRADWTEYSNDMEPEGLYEKLTADPAFLNLTAGYRWGGATLTKSRLVSAAHDTRVDLAAELVQLSQPYPEPFLLGCPSVMQLTQECVTELARDVDRLVYEVDRWVLSRDQLSEKADCLAYQVRPGPPPARLLSAKCPLLSARLAAGAATGRQVELGGQPCGVGAC